MTFARLLMSVFGKMTIFAESGLKYNNEENTCI